MVFRETDPETGQTVEITPKGHKVIPAPQTTEPEEDPQHYRMVQYQTEQKGIPSDEALTQNAIDVMSNQGISSYGAYIDGRIIPWGQFTVTLPSGKQITPANRNELIGVLVDEQRHRYRLSGMEYGLQGYKPQVMPEGNVVYVKPVEPIIQPGYVPQRGDVQREPGGSIVNMQEQQPGDWRTQISQGIADFLGISRMETQEPYVMVDQYGNPMLRQEMYESGMVIQKPSPQEIAVGLLSIPQGAFFVSGFKAIPEATIRLLPWVETGLARGIGTGLTVAAGVGFGGAAVQQYLQEKSPAMREFQLMILGGQVAAGLSVSGIRISELPQRIQEMRTEFNIRHLKGFETTYNKTTGQVTMRGVYDIFGREIRSPFVKTLETRTGLDFFEYGPPKPVPEPMGIAQGPQWRPTTPTEVNIIHQGELHYVEPIVSARWQPLTGTYEPYIKTGYEIIVPESKAIVPKSSGVLVEYDPIFQVVDPYVAEIRKTLDLISPRWQPKTGIPAPVEPSAKPVESIAPQKPFEIFFKPKPPEPRITKLGFDAEGNIVATKYGLTEPMTKRWQPLTGTYEQPQPTGYELWTTVYPKPTPYIPPGKLAVWEPFLPITEIYLESGLAQPYEELIRLKPQETKHVFDWKEIVQPEKPIQGGVTQEQKGGTVQILEEPVLEQPETKVLTETDLISEKETLVDMYTESETARMNDVRFFEEQITNQVSSQKQKAGVLSVFPPLYKSRQEQRAEERQQQIQPSESAFISLSKSMIQSVQDSAQDMDRMSLQDTKKIIIFEDKIKTDVKEVIDKIIPSVETPEEPGTTEPKIPKPPFLIEEEESMVGGPRSYVVQLRPRQYRNGERIAPGIYKDASPPLSLFDALSWGGHTVGNSEKASFKLRESDEKPKRLPKSIEPWTENLMKFTQKGENRWVEDSRYRIDSVGEKMNITMKGIEARRRL